MVLEFSFSTPTSMLSVRCCCFTELQTIEIDIFLCICINHTNSFVIIILQKSFHILEITYSYVLARPFDVTLNLKCFLFLNYCIQHFTPSSPLLVKFWQEMRRKLLDAHRALQLYLLYLDQYTCYGSPFMYFKTISKHISKIQSWF